MFLIFLWSVVPYFSRSLIAYVCVEWVQTFLAYPAHFSRHKLMDSSYLSSKYKFFLFSLFNLISIKICCVYHLSFKNNMYVVFFQGFSFLCFFAFENLIFVSRPSSLLKVSKLQRSTRFFICNKTCEHFLAMQGRGGEEGWKYRARRSEWSKKLLWDAPYHVLKLREFFFCMQNLYNYLLLP